MISKKRITIFTVILVLSIAFVVSGCRKKTFHNPERMRSMVSWHIDDVLDDIDATEEQTVKINAIKDRILDTIIAKHKAGKAEKLKAVNIWESENPDMTKIYAKIDKKTIEKKKMAYMIADALKEIHGILTNEQRAIIGKELRERLTD
ncbi:MAG: hypothetical protein GY714_09510 [Desulfobacterales bacterium]|nr:hypothetical protein [Desulfobacterales bacterium]